MEGDLKLRSHEKLAVKFNGQAVHSPATKTDLTWPEERVQTPQKCFSTPLLSPFSDFHLQLS